MNLDCNMGQHSGFCAMYMSQTHKIAIVSKLHDTDTTNEAKDRMIQ